MFNFISLYFSYITTYLGCSYICYLWDYTSYTERRQKTTLNKLLNIYNKILPNVLINIMVVSPIFTYSVCSLFDIPDKTNLYTIPSDLFFIIMLTEVFFYTLHRIAHFPLFYRRIHKTHHELTAPIGLGALYCHPLEMVLVNLPSVLLPCLILGVSFDVLALYQILATINTVIGSHSGYNKNVCKGDRCRAFHDIHHEKFNGNYGLGHFMDKIFKTRIY